MSRQQKLFRTLDKLYYDPASPGSYGGVERLVRSVRDRRIKGITRKSIKDYLIHQQAYTLHKPAKRKFLRNKTRVSGINRQWQADLCDMQGLRKQNKGVAYLLTVIDVFSKYAWVVPLKTKNVASMLNGFKLLFEKAHPRKPWKIQTDAGMEFLNKQIQNFLKSKMIHHFCSHSDKKAAVVERLNRTLKSRIWTYHTSRHTRTYISILDKIVYSYNHSYHRTIGISPAEVTKEMERDLYRKMFRQSPVKNKTKTMVKNGEMVRVSKAKRKFDKGYMPNWS